MEAPRPRPRPRAPPAARGSVAAPAVDAPGLPSGPHPAMRWIWFWRGLGIGALLAVPLGWPLLLPVGFGLNALGLDVLPAFLLGGALLAIAGVIALAVWARLAWRHYSFEIAADGVRIRRGILLRNETWIPYERIQDVVIRRGPLLRRRGLATLRLQTATPNVPSPHWGEGQLPGVADADAIARLLHERLRAATPRP